VHKKLLDKFFKENKVANDKLPSAAALCHFKIKLLLNQEINEETNKLISEFVFKDQKKREETVIAGKNEIESADAELVIRLMRRGVDSINQDALVYRALVFEDTVVPEVIKRLKTSLNDFFIETAARLLSICKMDIAEELINNFGDFRNPYAQSVVLLTLGFKADETHIPWLIDKYHHMKKLYPNKTYCEGAYYALYEIETRFYTN